ncbi:MAG: hypothetical protein LBH22_07595 [Bacteroidales bacterium]|jgi:hypothetical protein|nr:hypothetical protein [Bacteroidales bacterium]
MKKIITSFFAITLSLSVFAQIKVAEKEPELPRWWKHKDCLFAPYDSSYCYISVEEMCGLKGVPLSAFGKYIGQQIYRKYDEKYFEIIDTSTHVTYGSMTYRQWYFDLQEMQSGDRASWNFFDNTDVNFRSRNNQYIFVGGFIKLQQMFIGQNIYSVTRNNEQDWKCTDVVMDGRTISLLLVRKDGTQIKIRVPEEDKFFNHKLWQNFRPSNSNDTHWMTETQYRAMKQGEAKTSQQSTQQQAQRRQQLVAKFGATHADKIIAGKYEIGMSKVICREILNYHNRKYKVIEKTATAEVWEVGNTWLHFKSDKLEKINRL